MRLVRRNAPAGLKWPHLYVGQSAKKDLDDRSVQQGERQEGLTRAISLAKVGLRLRATRSDWTVAATERRAMVLQLECTNDCWVAAIEQRAMDHGPPRPESSATRLTSFLLQHQARTSTQPTPQHETTAFFVDSISDSRNPSNRVLRHRFWIARSG